MAVSTTTKKTWWSRLIMGLNNLMNPNHAWRDYENDPDSSSTFDALINSADDVLQGLSANTQSIVDRLTQAHQTGAEKEAQAFSAEEAQKSRDFTEYMSRNKYQMETQSMEQSGINPAMVYGGGNLVPTAANGAQGTPSAPGSSALNPFDIMMTMARMSRELSLLDSQKANIDSDTEKNKAEANKIGSENDLLELQVKYYPNLTEKEIEKFDSEIGLNQAEKDKVVSEKSLTDAKKVLQDFENKYADKYYALRNALEDATAHRELSREKLNNVQSALYEIERAYMDEYHMKMGTSEAYSICMAIMSAFGLNPDGLVGSFKQLGPGDLPDWLKNLIYGRNLPPHDGGGIGGGAR